MHVVCRPLHEEPSNCSNLPLAILFAWSPNLKTKTQSALRGGVMESVPCCCLDQIQEQNRPLATLSVSLLSFQPCQ